MKRKSVYLVGSQQQEHLMFEDEPSIIQGFVPNVESTRLVQNATTEESTSDNGSVRNTSKFRHKINRNTGKVGTLNERVIFAIIKLSLILILR